MQESAAVQSPVDMHLPKQIHPQWGYPVVMGSILGAAVAWMTRKIFRQYVLVCRRERRAQGEIPQGQELARGFFFLPPHGAANVGDPWFWSRDMCPGGERLFDVRSHLIAPTRNRTWSVSAEVAIDSPGSGAAKTSCQPWREGDGEEEEEEEESAAGCAAAQPRQYATGGYSHVSALRRLSQQPPSTPSARSCGSL